MGQLVYIKAKAGSENDLNRKLRKIKIGYNFTTAKMNQDWLDDINKNPKAYQRHLKPEDRDLTMEELKSIFPRWTNESLLDFDVAFKRISDADAKKLAKFIVANKDSLEYIKGGDSYLEKFNFTPEQIGIIKSLNLPEPETLR